MPTLTVSFRVQTRPGPGYLAELLAELARALAAERRYHKLRRDGLSTTDISRRIFKEFYASDVPWRHRAMAR
jgi:hypothetical protein